MVQGEVLSSFFNKEAPNHIRFGVKIVPLKFNRNEVKELSKTIKDETRIKLQEILEKLIRENSEFQKGVIFKRTDGVVYVQVNFIQEELGKFTVPAARALTNSTEISHAVGRRLDRLSLPNGIIIVSAGTTTLFAVVIDPEQNRRSMSDGINKKIDQTARLIRDIMG